MGRPEHPHAGKVPDSGTRTPPERRNARIPGRSKSGTGSRRRGGDPYRLSETKASTVSQ